MAEAPERMGGTTTGSVRDSAAGPATSVRVRAPARLHFGFLDLHGGLGRRFGSIGLAIDRPALQLKASPAPRASVKGAADADESERIRTYLLAAASYLDVEDTAAIEVEEAIPPHAGFGSGTQLALAVAAALARLNGRPFSAESFADALDRGNRSGVGLAAFAQGGLIVDGGRDDAGGPPPVVTRLPWPDAWRIVLIFDEGARGMHGRRESQAFRELPRFDEREAADICRIVLMQVLPAAVTGNFSAFGRGVTEIQARIGDYFAPQQGGRYASPAVADILKVVAQRGYAGYGQSSWGPTGFVLTASEDEAEQLVGSLGTQGRLRYMIAKGRNQGASITDV